VAGGGGKRAATWHSRRRQGQVASERRTHLVIGEVKTARSRRTLFLTPELVELLRRHRARLAEERMAIGPTWREHDLIYPSALGTPMDPDNVSHWFSRICRRAGLGHWHLHELRHSGASLMLAQGPISTWSRRFSDIRALPSQRTCMAIASKARSAQLLLECPRRC
jgi:integrase